MGSQHRTQPYQLAVRDLVQAGRIGRVVKISQEWDVNMPRWHQRAEARTLLMLTIMATLLFAANVGMLYSRAPHDAQAMLRYVLDFGHVNDRRRATRRAG